MHTVQIQQELQYPGVPLVVGYITQEHFFFTSLQIVIVQYHFVKV